MAFNFSNKAGNIRTYFDLKSNQATIQHPRAISDNCIVFTLRCKGFSLYNMKVCLQSDGSMFIASPSELGKDGKYHPLFAVYFSKADEEKLISDVVDMVHNEDANEMPFE